ncbi:Uncharacterised protein [Segatella copri]|nr:Uncharacterised protein [Segatella copri]
MIGKLMFCAVAAVPMPAKSRDKIILYLVIL